MDEFLKKLRKKYKIGFVGGSNLPKQIDQLGDNSEFLCIVVSVCRSETHGMRGNVAARVGCLTCQLDHEYQSTAVLSEHFFATPSILHPNLGGF